MAPAPQQAGSGVGANRLFRHN